MRPLFTSLVAALSSLGCAAEGGGDGGAAHLPDRGISGWTRAPDEGEDIYAVRGAIGGPSAIVSDHRVILFGQRPTADGDELVRMEGDADGLGFGEPVALGLSGHDPSVVRAVDGYWLAWVDDDGIAIATSSDGRAFQRQTASGIAAEREAPSIVIDGDDVHLFLSDGTNIVHARAGRDLAFGPESLALAPGVGCLSTKGEDVACWDADIILDAEVRLATTGSGERVFRMLYAAGSGHSDLGFAASYDGEAFTRFAFNPVYVGTFDELSATEVLSDGTYYLFWEEVRSTTDMGIGRAMHVPSAPSDHW